MNDNEGQTEGDCQPIEVEVSITNSIICTQKSAKAQQKDLSNPCISVRCQSLLKMQFYTKCIASSTC